MKTNVNGSYGTFVFYGKKIHRKKRNIEQQKEDVKKAVIDYIMWNYTIRFDDILTTSRKRELVEKRQLICWMLRAVRKENKNFYDNDYMFTVYEIANILSYESHATVLHGIRTVENLIETDKAKRLEYTKLKEEIFNILNTEK